MYYVWKWDTYGCTGLASFFFFYRMFGAEKLWTKAHTNIIGREFSQELGVRLQRVTVFIITRWWNVLLGCICSCLVRAGGLVQGFSYFLMFWKLKLLLFSSRPLLDCDIDRFFLNFVLFCFYFVLGIFTWCGQQRAICKLARNDPKIARNL